MKWVRVPGDGSARRQQVTGLTNGEAHTFEVRAGNRQEWGPAAEATATPAAAESPPPPPPPPLTVTYGASSYSAQEGGEAATVTVRLSPSASEALSIPITVNPRSGDFTVAGLTDGALSFSSGAERQTFTVAANQDDDWDDEEVTLGFGTPLPEGVSAGTPATATVSLVDDDDTPGVVTVRPATAEVGTELTATLSDADGVVSIGGWQWHRRAPEATDWTPVSGATAAYTPVSADAGQYLQATVGYTDAHGPDKSAASAAIGPVTPRITSLTIAYGDSTYRAREGGSVTVTVRLSDAADQLLKIPVAIEADEGTEPTDFSDDLSNDTLSFTQHVTLQTFTITANEDDDTVDERVLLGFGDLPEGVVAGTPASATVTLVDGTGTVTLISTTPQVGRPLTAVLTDPDGGIHVNTWHWQWRARDTDEWEPPLPTTRYPGLTSFTPQAEHVGKRLRVTVYYTDAHGPNKSAQSGVTEPVTSPPLTVAFSSSSYQASEGGSAATVTVRLSPAVSSGLRIPISVDPRSGPFTLAGLGTDTTLTIASGISGTFTIRADQDADRVDETVALGFRDLPSGVVAGTPSSATVTLTDDDVLVPRVSFDPSTYEATEGGAAETVTVRLSRAATEVLRIPISVDPRSGPFTLAGLGTDTTLTIASGVSGTFTIRADQDADRVDETVALGFRDLPSGVVAGTPSSATVSLTDGAPSAPTNVRVGPASSQGHQRLTVSWTAPPETVTGYQYRVGSGSLQSVPGTSATIGGLSPATSYQVQVRARNDYGISGWASGSGSTECRAPSISGPASVSGAGEHHLGGPLFDQRSRTGAAAAGCPWPGPTRAPSISPPGP